MFTVSIPFEDFNGVSREQEFMFNINRAEAIKLENSVNGGITEYIKKCVSSMDVKGLTKMFDELIHLSYGEKSLDGVHFEKKDKDGRSLADAFETTNAYDWLFYKLLTDTDFALSFINGILPKTDEDKKK